MSRGDLERLSRDELIKLVLKLRRPAKTSRTSSKPPSTDRKERREQSRPGGARPGHEGHSRVIAEAPGTVVDHRPTACPDCGLALSADLPAGTVSVHEHIELPEVKPLVEQHRRLAMACPRCWARMTAPRPRTPTTLSPRRVPRADLPPPPRPVSLRLAAVLGFDPAPPRRRAMQPAAWCLVIHLSDRR